jgi:tetratricopeptide (TPR) repeat protein
VPEWTFVQLLREYFIVNRELRSVFEGFRRGDPCFPVVAELVGDSETNILFRLKEHCHGLFRRDPSRTLEIRREVLFDLTVGSLFHEAMKLRENLYQQEVYVPRVEYLLSQDHDDGGDFLREFEKIQRAGADRTLEALNETENLVRQTRNQLRALLEAYAGNGLMTRYLIENPEVVEDVFDESLAEVLEAIHGGASEGYCRAAQSYLESAFFDRALFCLERAATYPGDHVLFERLSHYAGAMAAFSKADYGDSLKSLQSWIEAIPEAEEVPFLELAISALSRLRNLVNESEDPGLANLGDSLLTQMRGRAADLAPAV